MPRYLTVVFEINDEKVFKNEVPDLHGKMFGEKGDPWRITAMSLDDEMTRLDLLEQASSIDDCLLVMGDIFGASDIASKTLDDFTDH
jgi:hypothetical protein